MKNFAKARIKVLILISMFVFSSAYTQVPTYTIDTSFNIYELFKDTRSVSDFYFLPDGKILVGGYFDNEFLGGMGMIYPNGQLDNSWEGNEVEFHNVLEIVAQEDGYIFPSIYGMGKVNLDGVPWLYIEGFYFCEYMRGSAVSPYNVERIWDIYQMENGDLLLGGAIANDTLLPYELRGISRIHADGSHDPTFPVLNITPNTANGAVQKIYRAPDGAWYISGGFTAINGHETNRVARLTAEFEVDTTFVSPFVYDGIFAYSSNIILVDSQSRLWVSGYLMNIQDNPDEIIQLIRLLPNGEVDTTFLPRTLENIYSGSWVDVPTIALGAQELNNEPGKYIIYGQFNYFEDTLQPCITVVNDAGSIQHNYFQDKGATINVYNEAENPMMPRIKMIKQRPDGSLLIGGGFSQFMGETRYSVVKLKQGFVGIEEPNQKIDLNLYPNPASEKLNVSLQSAFAKSGVIYNAMGMQVLTFQFKNQETQVDITTLQPGIYFLKVQLETGQVGVRKFVKIR